MGSPSRTSSRLCPVCGLSVRSGCSRRLRRPSAPAALVAINPLVLVEENLSEGTNACVCYPSRPRRASISASGRGSNGGRGSISGRSHGPNGFEAEPTERPPGGVRPQHRRGSQPARSLQARRLHTDERWHSGRQCVAVAKACSGAIARPRAPGGAGGSFPDHGREAPKLRSRFGCARSLRQREIERSFASATR